MSNRATAAQLLLIWNMMRTRDQIMIVADKMESHGVQRQTDLNTNQAEEILSELIDYLRRVLS